ncbi:hypothetical protein A9K69_10560 [Stenotrophomonas maltophilia]|nr:hypothetical protein [Stenotrophomonas maltophilia]MBA0392140.1 hypothetical protein [Stenotrophomonas maltophilia]OBU53314.1 hypothetical protein A9K69_10560 [Stenotrophomonas maltophilia]PSD27392.1 hypothetical protein C7E18_08740 [Stenotrophomonas maltophilia]
MLVVFVKEDGPFIKDKEHSMKEISADQIDSISGGWLPWAAVAAFVYYERNEIADFVGGVLDGFNGTSYMEPK